jgi:hypothetical protein
MYIECASFLACANRRILAFYSAGIWHRKRRNAMPGDKILVTGNRLNWA